MRQKLSIKGIAMLVCVFSTHLSAQSLYKLNGKEYKQEELSGGAKQDFFEVDAEAFQRKKMLIENAALDMYFTEEAKKQKTTVEKIKEKSFAGKDPTEKEIQEFYNKHKDRIPPNYTFDAIKPQLVEVMKKEKQNEKRKELLDKLHKQKTLEITLAEPQAPQMTINTLNYPSKGNAKSNITIVEFADYQCPHCKQAFDEMKKMWPKIEGKVRFIFMDYPINPSGISKKIAIGAQCAQAQNKFWEFHNMAYEKQKELTNDSPLAFAKTLKLDEKKFKDCTEAPATKEIVEKSQAEGANVGVNGTPAIYVNGKKIMLGMSLEDSLLKAIERESNQKKS